MTANEFISEVFFNLDPVLNPLNLQYNVVNNAGGSLEQVSTGTNAFKADGDGSFDLHFAFSTNPPRFGDNRLFVIDLGLAGPSTLLLQNLVWQSQPPSGGNGPFYSAAHVQGIGPLGGPDGSTWIATSATPTPFNEDPIPTPEPASMVLLYGLARVGRVPAVG